MKEAWLAGLFDERWGMYNVKGRDAMVDYCRRYELDLGPISQNNKIHRKTNFQYHHRDLYCDITLYLATTIDLKLRSI